MKRMLIALALLASVQVASAQVKSVADAKKALDGAIAASQNAKKATKAATWLKLGQCYQGIYDAPYGDLWTGASRQELSLIMKEKPTATEQVEVGGQAFVKETYADKNLYFDAAGKLQIIQPTNIVDPDALTKAVDAFKQAYSLDPKKGKDIKAAFETLSKKMVQEAYNKYTFGDLAGASRSFEDAVATSALEPLSQIDTNSLYNAGFTAWATGDKERAKGFFEKCYEYGYYADGGEVFAKLADVDTLQAKRYLEEGFEMFPQSQSILIGLINQYLKSGESTDRLFELLDKAKANEPNNASLYYVEGNIRNQLGDAEKAIEAYDKCAEVNPNYEYGHIGKGVLYYNKAYDLQTQAQSEMDDNKYEALVQEFEQSLKACIEPFEKAYALSRDEGVKVTLAEYLKNVYFKFREEDPAYQAAYDKYNEIVKTAKGQ